VSQLPRSVCNLDIPYPALPVAAVALITTHPGLRSLGISSESGWAGTELGMFADEYKQQSGVCTQPFEYDRNTVFVRFAWR